jgi:hypothetical protein
MPKIGRNAATGRFVSVKHAQKHPKTTVVETVGRAKGKTKAQKKKK